MISVWKAGLLTNRPQNFLLERRKKYESNLLKYCENIVKKDSLYPLIKHHVPLCLRRGLDYIALLTTDSKFSAIYHLVASILDQNLL
jgi:hypothetical protein